MIPRRFVFRQGKVLRFLHMFQDSKPRRKVFLTLYTVMLVNLPGTRGISSNRALRLPIRIPEISNGECNSTCSFWFTVPDWKMFPHYPKRMTTPRGIPTKYTKVYRDFRLNGLHVGNEAVFGFSENSRKRSQEIFQTIRSCREGSSISVIFGRKGSA